MTLQFATFCYLFIKNIDYKHADFFKPIFIHGVHKSSYMLNEEWTCIRFKMQYSHWEPFTAISHRSPPSCVLNRDLTVMGTVRAGAQARDWEKKGNISTDRHCYSDTLGSDGKRGRRRTWAKTGASAFDMWRHQSRGGGEKGRGELINIDMPVSDMAPWHHNYCHAR